MRTALGDTRFAVIDLETTGIYPGGHDRIIEVAVVRMSPLGEIEDEYVTLVNPRRDIGRSDIHGIHAADVQDAPVWAEVAGDVGERLAEAIVAGHQLRFDLGFLAAEYRRLGVTLPTLPGVCTLDLAFEFMGEQPVSNRVANSPTAVMPSASFTRMSTQLLAMPVQRQLYSGASWTELEILGRGLDRRTSVQSSEAGSPVIPARAEASRVRPPRIASVKGVRTLRGWSNECSATTRRMLVRLST